MSSLELPRPTVFAVDVDHPELGLLRGDCLVHDPMGPVFWGIWRSVDNELCLSVIDSPGIRHVEGPKFDIAQVPAAYFKLPPTPWRHSKVPFLAIADGGRKR